MFKHTATLACALSIMAGSTALAEGDTPINRNLSDYTWEETGLPGVQSTVMFEDEDGTNGVAFRIESGAWVPMHTHAEPYHATVFQGVWAHQTADGEIHYLYPGAYVYQPGGQPHADGCASQEPCIILGYRKTARTYAPFN